MNDVERRILSRQLAAQAELLKNQDGGELAGSLTRACCALLQTARGIELDENFDVVYFSYIQLSEEIESFFFDAMKRLETERDTDEYIQVLERLKAARTRSDEVRTSREQAEKEFQDLQERTERDRKRLEKAQEELKRLSNEYSTIWEQMEGCSQDRIDAQKDENNKLREICRQNQERLSQLENKNKEVADEIKKLDWEIQQMPNRNKELVSNYQKMKADLDLLKQAETECSPERQAEIMEETKQLQANINRWKQIVERLQCYKTELQKHSIHCDERRHTLSTDVLELWENTVADLREAVAEHESAIEEIDTTARTLTQRLEACKATRQSYSFWLDAATTPLQAMMDAVGRPESEKLRETLDPASMDHVKRLSEEIEDRLKKLDEILSRCSSAVREDQRVLKIKAGY